MCAQLRERSGKIGFLEVPLTHLHPPPRLCLLYIFGAFFNLQWLLANNIFLQVRIYVAPSRRESQNLADTTRNDQKVISLPL